MTDESEVQSEFHNATVMLWTSLKDDFVGPEANKLFDELFQTKGNTQTTDLGDYLIYEIVPENHRVMLEILIHAANDASFPFHVAAGIRFEEDGQPNKYFWVQEGFDRFRETDEAGNIID